MLNLDTGETVPHLFIIYYKKEKNKYYLRAYKEKNIKAFPIVLIKLNSELVLIYY